MGKGGQQLKHGGVHDENRVDSGAITESGVKQKKRSLLGSAKRQKKKRRNLGHTTKQGTIVIERAIAALVE